jgi:hypothetical protein
MISTTIRATDERLLKDPERNWERVSCFDELPRLLDPKGVATVEMQDGANPRTVGSVRITRSQENGDGEVWYHQLRALDDEQRLIQWCKIQAEGIQDATAEDYTLRLIRNTRTNGTFAIFTCQVSADCPDSAKLAIQRNMQLCLDNLYEALR